MEEKLGFKFFAWLAGVIIAGGVVLLIVLLLFSRAVYAWGFLGAFLVLALILLAVGWFYDRREARRYGDA
jgi:hypothetical protein